MRQALEMTDAEIKELLNSCWKEADEIAGMPITDELLAKIKSACKAEREKLEYENLWDIPYNNISSNNVVASKRGEVKEGAIVEREERD